jgi:hypothetical protein
MLAHKCRAPTDELEIRVIGSALLAVVFVALDLWQSGGGKSDLLELLDQAIDSSRRAHASSAERPAEAVDADREQPRCGSGGRVRLWLYDHLDRVLAANEPSRTRRNRLGREAITETAERAQLTSKRSCTS